MIIGLDAVTKDLDKLGAVDLRKATQQALQLVQAAAKLRASVDSGELRESIYTNIEQADYGCVGTCYTNKSYAAYVEFGTGPKGQRSHEGISPDVAVAYRQSPWWIHESQIDKALAERYHWFFIDTEDGRFYQCSGQPARPFLYPALNDNRENIREIYADYISAQIGV